MRRATRVVAAALGVFAGIGGPEHGIFEMLQGHTRPEGLMIAAMGPPCDPEKVWNLCEPAMTVVPSFLVTGILATLVGIMTIVWAAGFVHRKRGGLILILLSVALLLVGGGLFPPVIGVIGGIVATRVHVPPKERPEGRFNGLSRFLAALWPWSLVAFFVWVFGQFIIGYFSNDWLMQSGFLAPLLILGLMGLSIVSGFARDAQEQAA
jgi:hypothetical protein